MRRRAFLAGAATFALSIPGRSVASTRGRTLVFARNTDDPRRDATRFQRFADYLAPQLRGVGIDTVTIRFANSIEQLTNLLRSQEADVLSDTIYATLIYRARAATEIVLLEHRGGYPFYRSIMFARQDSPISTLHDLVGRRIGFEDRASTSSYILPASALRAAGLQLAMLPSPHAPVPANHVGCAFAGSELSVSTWVHRGLVDAGALSDLDWLNTRVVPEVVRSSLHVFYESPPVIRALISVRPGLDPQVQQAMTDALLRMHEEPAGRSALRSYYNIARFEPIVGHAAEMLSASIALLRPVVDVPLEQ